MYKFIKALKLFFIFIFCSAAGFSFAPCVSAAEPQQNIVDSLEKKWKEEKSDKKKILLSGDLCWENLMRGNFEKALEYAKKELELSEKIKDEKSIAQAYSDIGVVYYNKSDYHQALKSYTNSLLISQRINDTAGIGKSYNNLGATHQSLDDYSKALEYFLKAMNIYEETNNKKAVHAILNNIGTIYRIKDNFPKALEYFEKSLKIKKELGDQYEIARTLCNIANVYDDQGNSKRALEIHNECLSIQKDINDQAGVATSLLNIGVLYRKLGELKKGLDYYQNSLKITSAIGDKHGTASVLNRMGNIYFDLEEYSKSLDYYQKGLLIAKEIDAGSVMMKSYEGLAKSNANLKNFEKAYEYFELYSSAKDSIFNLESNNQLFELQTKYETEKKEKEIELLNKDKEVASTESKRQRLFLLFVAAVAAAVAIIAVVIFRSLKITRKQKHIIELQKDEVTLQRDIVGIQKEEISHKNKELTDSINYAQRIQSAILTSEQYLNEMFLPKEQSASHFILFKPKDIVAGDFYWAFKTQNDKAIWIAADCTGHGVPGAFMSMIGNSLLNEIVVEKGIHEPDEILNRLREGIIKALGQGIGTDEKRKDGMDAAVCVWEKSTNKLSFSGANNCLWIVRSTTAPERLSGGEIKNSPSPLEKGIGGDTLSLPKGEVIELAADPQPVGHHVVMNPFTKREIQLNSGDTLYSFTDGYCDQFGGPKGKKFKYKPFKELLVSIQLRTMAEQREILNDTIEKWKNELEQVDDICVIGVRV